MKNYGTLYIVATPIGNLQDMSPRAISILQQVDAIAAEDTRHSKPLLQHFSITTPCFAYHAHNENDCSISIIEQLLQGKSIALISDAGTPLISDPGYPLIQKAQQAGIKVIPIPGSCAAITALCASGLPADKFFFEGFLPAKSAARIKRLQELKHSPHTIIFYESPHRILETMNDMLKVFGKDRDAVIARELTKTFETIHRDNIDELLNWLQADPNQQRGEFVVLIKGIKEESEAETINTLHVLDILLSELPVKQAAHLAAKITGKKKNQLYEIALGREKS